MFGVFAIARCVLFLECCVSYVVCRLLSVYCNWLFARCVGSCCVLRVGWWSSRVVSCLLFVVCCLCVVCVSFAGCLFVLHVVSGVLFVVSVFAMCWSLL